MGSVAMESVSMASVVPETKVNNNTNSINNTINNTKDKLIIFGDSITAFGSAPAGYVSLLQERLQNSPWRERVEILASGIPGNTVLDLLQRVQRDVLDHKPRWVLLYVGTNDLWRVDFDTFTQSYRQLVAQLQAAKISVLVCTPATTGEKIDGRNEREAQLQQYSEWIAQWARAQHLPALNLYQVFHEAARIENKRNQPLGFLTNDGVHMNKRGNQRIADHLWPLLNAEFGKTGL